MAFIREAFFQQKGMETLSIILLQEANEVAVYQAAAEVRSSAFREILIC